MEMLDIVDTFGEPTGKTIERNIAHKNGTFHRTSHVWIFRKQKGSLEVLLQKRSAEKDSYPNCYDISSAGHIPAGSDYMESAIRELKEELNIDININQLIFCGKRNIHFEDIFHGEKFVDNQVTNIYLMFYNIEAEKIVFQKEEIQEVIWIDFKKCIEMVKNNSFKNCIVMEELEMLKGKLIEMEEYNG